MHRPGAVLATLLFLQPTPGLAVQAHAAQVHEIAQCSGCGCRGGPGYRAPNGRCVGWKELRRVCGDPPETRCTPELVNERPRTDATEAQPRTR